MDIFGIFKKKKPQVKKYTGTAEAVGRALGASMRKDQAALKGDTDATKRRLNAVRTPMQLRKMRMMKERAI